MSQAAEPGFTTVFLRFSVQPQETRQARAAAGLLQDQRVYRKQRRLFSAVVSG